MPHISSGQVVMLVLACTGSPFGGPGRRGASSPWVRISRRTRLLPRWKPRKTRRARSRLKNERVIGSVSRAREHAIRRGLEGGGSFGTFKFLTGGEPSRSRGEWICPGHHERL